MNEINLYPLALVIDTALPKTVVMLFVRGQLCQTLVSDHVRRADNLLELIETVFASSQYTKADLTHIIVRRGLGSYTGLRVGVTVASTLAWSLGVPILAFELLDKQTMTPDLVRVITFELVKAGVVPRYGSWHDGTDSAIIK